MHYGWLAPIAGLSAILFAAFSTWSVLREETGTDTMNSISAAIRQAAVAFMRRQYVTITVFVALAALALGFYVGAFTGVAFAAGAICSAAAGYVGMSVALRANVRTAQAARGQLGAALMIAFRGGSVMGMMVVGLALLGVYLLYIASGDPFEVVGFGVGASLVGLFARVGGGIYTKAADVGADLVGKIEIGIPEDDPRNPGVIADLVGDNVGDTAGMGADLFESNVGSLLAAMLIGVIGLQEYGPQGVVFPLTFQAMGVLATIVETLAVGAWKRSSPRAALNSGLFTAAILVAVAAYFLARGFFGEPRTFYAALSGIAAAVLLGLITQY